MTISKAQKFWNHPSILLNPGIHRYIYTDTYICVYIYTHTHTFIYIYIQTSFSVYPRLIVVMKKLLWMLEYFYCKNRPLHVGGFGLYYMIFMNNWVKSILLNNYNCICKNFKYSFFFFSLFFPQVGRRQYKDGPTVCHTQYDFHEGQCYQWRWIFVITIHYLHKFWIIKRANVATLQL